MASEVVSILTKEKLTNAPEGKSYFFVEDADGRWTVSWNRVGPEMYMVAMSQLEEIRKQLIGLIIPEEDKPA